MRAIFGPGGCPQYRRRARAPAGSISSAYRAASLPPTGVHLGASRLAVSSFTCSAATSVGLYSVPASGFAAPHRLAAC